MKCRICLHENLEPILDFGHQPVCNRFGSKENPADPPKVPLALVQCDNCGLLQLAIAPDAHVLTPEVDWIIYNEAEGHLDDTVQELLTVSSLTPESRILGISYKDRTTVNRLENCGGSQAYTLDPKEDLGICSPNAGLEAIEGALTPDCLERLAARYGKADVLIVRHILEHTRTPRTFVSNLLNLLAPDGIILFEVPDFSTTLQACDYQNLWEEHFAYYTPQTFHRAMSILGLEPLHFMAVPYPLENALLCIAKKHPGQPARFQPPSVNEYDAAKRYRDAFPEMKRKVQQFLAKRSAAGHTTALFGAGHLACKFINFFEIAEYISFVADDHPAKKGLLMAGSNIPILGSEQLIEQHIDLCLLTLSPESEIRVREKQQEYLSQGGQFASVFPAADSFFLKG